MTLELIFIGDHFYLESGTRMSCIYQLDGRRFDWGKVNVALQNGDTVNIRPATEGEIEPFTLRLAEIKAERD